MQKEKASYGTAAVETLSERYVRDDRSKADNVTPKVVAEVIRCAIRSCTINPRVTIKMRSRTLFVV